MCVYMFNVTNFLPGMVRM